MGAKFSCQGNIDGGARRGSERHRAELVYDVGVDVGPADRLEANVHAVAQRALAGLGPLEIAELEAHAAQADAHQFLDLGVRVGGARLRVHEAEEDVVVRPGLGDVVVEDGRGDLEDIVVLADDLEAADVQDGFGDRGRHGDDKAILLLHVLAGEEVQREHLWGAVDVHDLLREGEDHGSLVLVRPLALLGGALDLEHQGLPCLVAAVGADLVGLDLWPLLLLLRVPSRRRRREAVHRCCARGWLAGRGGVVGHAVGRRVV